MNNTKAKTAQRRKTTYAKRTKPIATKEQADNFIQAKLEKRATARRAGATAPVLGVSKQDEAANKRTTRAANVMAASQMGIADAAVEKDEKAEAKELEAHLVSLSPFNHRWNVKRTLNSGSYGVVFLCTDVKTSTKGVVKVARICAGNDTAGWESFIMEKIFKTDPSANIVRLLDKGMLEDQVGQQLEFMVLECCEIPVKKYLGASPIGPARKARVCHVVLGALKGIYDLHNQGLLHRDLKPDNMGIKSKEEPVALLYDLGMARMYTDSQGDLRPPRTICPFKGTIEWASGHATKGRDQTRWDDLIAWLYICVELFDPDLKSETPYPWDNDDIRNTKASRYLKSSYSPSRLLLRHCPPQFYSIHTYLLCANRVKVPNYEYIAYKVAEAWEECKSAAKH